MTKFVLILLPEVRTVSSCRWPTWWARSFLRQALQDCKRNREPWIYFREPGLQNTVSECLIACITKYSECLIAQHWKTKPFEVVSIDLIPTQISCFRTTEYRNHPNTGHPNTGFIWIKDFLVSGIQMAFWYLKCPVFEWFGSTDTKMPFENRTICKPDNFWPFEYRTCPVFRWLLFISSV